MTLAPTASPTLVVLACTDNCILWGIPAVDFGVAMLLGALLLCSTCVNYVLFALLSMIFKWFRKFSWVPVVYKLIPSTLWFLRLSCVFGIFSLLVPANSEVGGVVDVLFYVVAVPFCLAMLYWADRVLKQAAVIVVNEDSERFNKMQQHLLKISPFSTFDYAASAAARQSSVHQMLTLLRYACVLLLLWIAFKILGIDVGVLLDETSFFCLVIILPLVQTIRSFALGTLWLFVYEKDEWSLGFAPGNMVLLGNEMFEMKKCVLRDQIICSEEDGSVMFLPHSWFSDRLGSSVNGRRKITTPFRFKFGIQKHCSTQSISKMIDKLELYLGTIHPDLSTSYEQEDYKGGGRIAFDCKQWALDIYIHEVCSTYESEAILYGEIVLGVIEIMGDMHLEDPFALNKQQLLHQSKIDQYTARGYVYYALELPLRYT